MFFRAVKSTKARQVKITYDMMGSPI